MEQYFQKDFQLLLLVYSFTVTVCQCHILSVIQSVLLHFEQSDIRALPAKYRISSLSLPTFVQKNYIWTHWVNKAVDVGHLGPVFPPQINLPLTSTGY